MLPIAHLDISNSQSLIPGTMYLIIAPFIKPLRKRTKELLAWHNFRQQRRRTRKTHFIEDGPLGDLLLLGYRGQMGRIAVPGGPLVSQSFFFQVDGLGDGGLDADGVEI